MQSIHIITGYRNYPFSRGLKELHVLNGCQRYDLATWRRVRHHSECVLGEASEVHGTRHMHTTAQRRLIQTISSHAACRTNQPSDHIATSPLPGAAYIKPTPGAILPMPMPMPIPTSTPIPKPTLSTTAPTSPSPKSKPCHPPCTPSTA